MIEAFKRVTSSVLARLGEDALLRGEVVDPPRRVSMARNVEMYDRDGNVLYVEHVGTFSKLDAPAKGDTLVFIDADGVPIPGESYVLDTLGDDNGYSVRFVMRKTP